MKPLLSDYLEKEGFVLVDSRFSKAQGRGGILEILVDRAEGGITLDECTRLNKELGVFLDASDTESESYTLDVSSPGLDRPLVIAADFRRVCGKEVRAFLKEAVAERIEHEGIVESVKKDSFILRTKDKTIEILLEKLNKAKQVIL